jgi:multidrug efflux system membrane fusion protein
MTIASKEETAPGQWQRVPNRNSPGKQLSRLARKRGMGKILAGGALFLVLGGFWYYNHRAGDQPRGPRITAAPVRVAKVIARDMPVVERTIGTVVAYDTVQVTPQVAGRVQSVAFKEGQMVKKGDLLFQIDPRPFEAARGQVRGQLAKDQAALDGARRDLKRFQALMAVNAESQQIVDDQSATVAADEGTVEADKANLQTAELNVEYTQIRSPVDGKTGAINIMPGNVISVTGTTATVNPLVTISQIQPVNLSFVLPQIDLPRIQARQKTGALLATVDLSDIGGKNFTVPVDFLSNAVNNTTGTIELRATDANTDADLVPGQLVNVMVELSDIPGAIVVPHEALTAGPSGQYVYAIESGKARQVAVTVLFDDSRNVAVQGALKPGDEVVVDGQLEVVPGGAVQVVRDGQTTADPPRTGRKGGGDKRPRS